MPAPAKDKKLDRVLAVRVQIGQPGADPLPAARVYVFDAAHRLLTSEPLPPGPTAALSIKLPPGERSAQQLRVLVAPALPAEADPTAGLPPWMTPIITRAGLVPADTLYDTLKRRGAAELKVGALGRPDPGDLHVRRADWMQWLTCACKVSGRLVKRVKKPDGTTEHWGVCHACVQIWEVDKFPHILPLIPDDALFRIRDELLDLLRRPPFPPEKLVLPPKFRRPWPPPPPEPLLLHSLAPQPAFTSGNAEAAAGESQAATLQLSAELEGVIYAASAVQIRNALALAWNKYITILCGLHELTAFLTKHLLKCVCTDEDGYFETTLWYPCAGDHPDLYFSAGQCIGGAWHWLYQPALRCHVYWDYACGTEVLLETTDPQARVCAPTIPVDPPPGVLKWVMPYAVGAIPVQSIKATGLVDHNFGMPAVDAPWGAVLGFRVGHAASIPTAQLRYYRWLVKKPGALTFIDLAAPAAVGIYKTYVDYDLATPLEPPSFPLYFLGPQGINSMLLYEFRPHDPPALAGHYREWPGGDYTGEIYSAVVDSGQLDTGLHTFRLEVYDNAGVKVEPAGATFEFILKDLTGEDSHVAAAGEGLVNGGFEFSLYIDNRACTAAIAAPTAGGTGANPNCGFLQFEAGDTVGLSFAAIHPENRARFSHWVRRGANVLFTSGGEVDAASVPIVPGGPTPAEQNLTGDGAGNFTASLSPGFLLGACSEAAFAEMLEVYAKATNGWDRLSNLDDQTEWAFALTPD